MIKRLGRELILYGVGTGVGRSIITKLSGDDASAFIKEFLDDKPNNAGENLIRGKKLLQEMRENDKQSKTVS